MSHISPADTSQRFPDNFVFGGATAAYQAVSYTHLTLPTILLV